MDDRAIAELARIRDGFAACDEDMRHVLLWIDVEIWHVPDVWGRVDPDLGYADWGMPAESLWRQTPDDFRPRAIVAQRHDRGWPYHWIHTFHGDAAWGHLRKLSYRAVRWLADSDSELIRVLPRHVRLEGDHPTTALREPQLWWMRAVHGLALCRPPGSDLAADEWASADGVELRERPGGIAAASRAGRPLHRLAHSVLQGTVFEASAQALDFLLNPMKPDAADPPPPRQGGQLPGAAGVLVGIEDQRRREDLNLPESLIRYMTGRDRVSYDEILQEVHGDEDLSHEAIRSNITRANKLLAGKILGTSDGRWVVWKDRAR